MDAEMKGYRTGINDGKERSSGPDWLRYADIIDKQHHVSKKHPPMSMEDRAAQFSPFAALTGYDAAIVETARLTAQRVELDEYERQALNKKLQFISEHLNEHPKVSITCFVPDARKEGGEYVTVTGNIKKLDDYEHRIVLMDGSRILMEDVIGIEDEL